VGIESVDRSEDSRAQYPANDYLKLFGGQRRSFQ
jgi:hypothetical protein